MKKIVISLILILILSATSFADAIKTSPGTFEIKAYKLNRNAPVTITIVDALTGSLNEILKDDELIIDGYFTPGVASSATEENVDDIAFAYRVSGNTAGTYTVTITVNPFIEKVKNENGDEIDGDHAISARYFLVNETVRFLDSNKTTTSDYVEGEKGLKIENTDAEPNRSDFDTSDDYEQALNAYSQKKDSGVLTSGSDSLSDSFRVTGNSNDTNDFWIARGAVGFVVDKVSYESAPEGIYKATITVTLQGDS